MGEKCWLEKEREVWVWSRQVSVHSIPIVDMPLNCVTSFSYSAVIIMEQSAVLICLLCNLYQSDRHYWCAPVAWLPSWSIHFHTRFHDLASLSLVNVNPPSPSARYDHSLSGDLLLPHFLAYTWALETVINAMRVTFALWKTSAVISAPSPGEPKIQCMWWDRPS